MAVKTKSIIIAVVLAILATMGAVAGFTSVGGNLFMPKPASDFTISSSPSSSQIQQGYSNTFTLTIESTNGFAGIIAVTGTVNPTGPTIDIGNSISLASGGSALDSATIIVPASTGLGNYTVTFTGKSGTLSHSAMVMLKVTSPPPPPPPDFAISASPSNIDTTTYSNMTSTISISSLSGYAGTVSLVTSISFGSNSTAVVSPTNLVLHANGTNSTILVVRTGRTIGSFLISITGTSGSHVRTLVVPLTITQNGGTEALNLEYSAFTNSTSLVMNIRNVGSVSVALVIYYVFDSNGNEYALNPWNGPVIGVNQLATVNVYIGANCKSCTLNGSPFVFTPGYSYTIEVVTARNNTFYFTVTR